MMMMPLRKHWNRRFSSPLLSPRDLAGISFLSPIIPIAAEAQVATDFCRDDDDEEERVSALDINDNIPLSTFVASPFAASREKSHVSNHSDERDASNLEQNEVQQDRSPTMDENERAHEGTKTNPFKVSRSSSLDIFAIRYDWP